MFNLAIIQALGVMTTAQLDGARTQLARMPETEAGRDVALAAIDSEFRSRHLLAKSRAGFSRKYL